MPKQDPHGHRVCQNCHGNRVVIVINKKGLPEEKTCPACHGQGTVNPRLV